MRIAAGIVASGIGMALWIGLPAGPARGAVSTVVGSDVAGTSSVGVARVPCGEGAITLGGGLDPENVVSMILTSTAPAFGADPSDRLIFRSDGTSEAGVEWQATSLNEGAAKTIKVAAVCATGVAATTEVASRLAPASSATTQTVLCPEGSVAVGGGVDVSNVAQMRVIAQAPVFGSGPPESLATRPNGPNPAPSGWSATIRNVGGGAQVFTVGAICSGDVRVVTEVGTLPLPAEGVGQTRLFCPEGYEAASGGILPSTTSAYVTSSAPAFGADPLDLLFLQPDGPGPAPVAWQWNVRNDATEVFSAKAGIVCVPEPGALGSACAAAATLFGVSARRRSLRAAAARRSRAVFPTTCW
jgi:hypothetical protein